MLAIHKLCAYARCRPSIAELRKKLEQEEQAKKEGTKEQGSWWDKMVRHRALICLFVRVCVSVCDTRVPLSLSLSLDLSLPLSSDLSLPVLNYPLLPCWAAVLSLAVDLHCAPRCRAAAERISAVWTEERWRWWEVTTAARATNTPKRCKRKGLMHASPTALVCPNLFHQCLALVVRPRF